MINNAKNKIQNKKSNKQIYSKFSNYISNIFYCGSEWVTNTLNQKI